MESLPLRAKPVSHTRTMVLRESIRVTHVQARAYHAPLSTLIPIPPSTRGASLHGTSEPHIGTAATSQFPRTRREAHWEATTVPPKSLMTLSYVSPQPLHRVQSRVEVPPEHVQLCVAYVPPQGRVLQTIRSANDRLGGGTLYTRWVAVKTR